MEDIFGHIFEDEQLLVVNKPAGLATQAPRQFDSLEARVRAYLDDQAASGTTPYVGIPHRLDRCVSGIVLFAKRKKAAQRLARQFEHRQVAKTYQAIVKGTPREVEGTWTDYVRKVPDEARSETVANSHPDAKRAVLHYVVKYQTSEFTHLRIRLETGRMHQIRLQCGSRQLPVLGDELYGSQQPFGPAWEHERERCIALHASTISVEHPKTRERQEFSAPLPAYWPSADA